MRFTLAIALGVLLSFFLGWGNATATETIRFCGKPLKITSEKTAVYNGKGEVVRRPVVTIVDVIRSDDGEPSTIPIYEDHFDEGLPLAQAALRFDQRLCFERSTRSGVSYRYWLEN